ncbi:hypothetical protein AA13595_0381 [Gluconacetobacter johannae DSM 13595]|nr:hypothetical protein AA13595_0381 [Gluconacetobacter johannae DSM 13595]
MGGGLTVTGVVDCAAHRVLQGIEGSGRHSSDPGHHLGGIGEVSTVSAFPALGSAIYAAMGQRRRRYPFVEPGV